MGMSGVIIQNSITVVFCFRISLINYLMCSNNNK